MCGQGHETIDSVLLGWWGKIQDFINVLGSSFRVKVS